MKLNLFRFMVLAAVAMVLGSTASAQAVNVRAQVPFAFVLGDKVYPAGEYAIQTAMDFSSLCVSNRSAEKSALTLSYPTTSPKPGKQTMLVFHRIGNTYFLYQVRVANSQVGRQFPRSRRETQISTRKQADQ